jgi:hypothetical protein
MLRVLVLDSVYKSARQMFRHFQEFIAPPAPAQAGGCSSSELVGNPLGRSKVTAIRNVALHPNTLSVYSRALGGYAEASRPKPKAKGLTKSVPQGGDGLEGGCEEEAGGEEESGSSAGPACRICTVEAVALLLKELGEADEVTEGLVQAVIVNNHAVSQDPLLLSTGSIARARERKKATYGAAAPTELSPK